MIGIIFVSQKLEGSVYERYTQTMIRDLKSF